MASTEIERRRRTDDAPRDGAFDSTLALLRQGYDFIGERSRTLRSRIFRSRLLLKPVICLSGAAAAEMFYNPDLFTRVGAMPPTTLRLLQDVGSVQSLSGSAHRHRKAMFLSLLAGQRRIDDALEAFRREWFYSLEEWKQLEEIVFFDEIALVLTRAATRWVGIPLDGESGSALCAQLMQMIEGAGSVGPTAWLALFRRWHTERYVEATIRECRQEKAEAPPGSPLDVIVRHRDEKGQLLKVRIAAVEILNILRPIVAVGRFLTFAAMALEAQPAWRQRFAAGDEEHLEPFIEEVRRYYPFFPFIGGRATVSFRWKGYHFSKGDWVVLDLFGTNHDPERFADPESFRPERAPSWRPQGFDFIPQGAGKADITHRCPGEALTVALMKETVRLLCRSVSYEVPPQDLRVDRRRIPARPTSGLRLSRVRPLEGRAEEAVTE